MTTVTTQQRQLKAHNKLIFDVITRQAGSIAKAILEGVMNSIDAKATACHITLNDTVITIRDDGQGIKSMTEIEAWFETFGTPHESSEGKTYGTFRIGRGQLFSYGVNIWTTGEFQMTLDVKNKGLEYQLQTGRKVRHGCAVEVQLYERLYPSVQVETEEQLKLWTRFAPIPIYLNDVQISVSCDESEWTHTTDDAYILLEGTGALDVYNLGIHVSSMSRSIMGCGGVVVSRKQLQVNFARNDVQSDCPVWRRIRPFVFKQTTETNLKRKVLDADQRRSLIRRFLTGELAAENFYSVRVFELVSGKCVSARELLSSNCLTCTDKGNLRGDKIQQHRLAWVISRETLQIFNVQTVAELVALLEEKSTYLKFRGKISDFEILAQGLAEGHELLPEKDWTVNEQIWIAVIRFAIRDLCEPFDPPPAAANYVLHNSARIQWCQSPSHQATRRRIRLGDSDTADGWTDGQTHITIARRYLRSLRFTVGDFVKLGVLVLHECTHVDADLETHVHSPHFYEGFHDMSPQLGKFAERCLSILPSILRRRSRKPTKVTLRNLDRVAQIRQGVEKLAEVEA